MTDSIERKLKAQYNQLSQDVPGLFANEGEFEHFISETYGRKTDGGSTRFYHSPEHNYQMSDQSSPWEQGQYNALATAINGTYNKKFTTDEIEELKRINRVAAPGHDMEYHVDGSMTEASKKILKNYIKEENGKLTIKNIDRSDTTAHIVLQVFGKKAGEELSTFNGQNEFLSALSWAKKLEKVGCDTDFITGVTAVIAATVPFKKPEDYRKLQDRLDNVYTGTPELTKKYSNHMDRQRRVDSLMGAATIFANKDVIGFIGNEKIVQELLSNKNLKPTAKSAGIHFHGSDQLVTEEGADALKTSKKPGVGYVPYDLFRPSLRPFRLWNILKADKENEAGTDKLFHNTTIRGGESGVRNVQFPPDEEIKRMNQFAMNKDGVSGNTDISILALSARIAALGIVHAVAQKAGYGDMDLTHFVKAITPENLKFTADRKNQQTNISAAKALRIARDVLANRSHDLPNDIKPSPIATQIAKILPAEKIMELAKVADNTLIDPKKDTNTKDPNPFLEEVTRIIGRRNMERLLDKMVESAQITKDLHEDTNARKHQKAQSLPEALVQVKREITSLRDERAIA